MQVWVEIPGFSKYEATADGAIRNRRTNRILKPVCYDGTGRPIVTLMTDEGVPRTQRIHVVICRTFHGPKPSPRHHAAHRDGNFKDNRADNVRWATPEENQADRVLHGTDIRGEQVHLAKLTEHDIPIIRRLRELHVPHRVIAYAYQVDTNAINLIEKGRTWKHVP